MALSANQLQSRELIGYYFNDEIYCFSVMKRGLVYLTTVYSKQFGKLFLDLGVTNNKMLMNFSDTCLTGKFSKKMYICRRQ